MTNHSSTPDSAHAYRVSAYPCGQGIRVPLTGHECIRKACFHATALAQDSSKPPSSDSPFRKPPRAGCRSRCRHRASPRRVRRLPRRPGLAQDAVPVGFSVSQVFDLPDPRLTVTEHRMLKVRCPCGHITRAADPHGVKAPAQYGPGVHALAAARRQSLRGLRPHRPAASRCPARSLQ
ncbi:IS66 family transposase zinc-finger binding domain-containing protein [Streptomyces sp. NPDC002838]|uniref:IS66 family transposase zinc-finger binding domain-containing protein n=1 Tax=Streptomyces sp. NPDC002838 TaxID=3154436 RepID=UPI00331FB876